MSDAASIFPIELHAVETPHYTQSPYRYRDTFLKAWKAQAGPRDSWYAFDVTINSRTSVSFVAYHIRDACWGGIGEVVWRGRANVPAELTAEDVDRVIMQAAEHRREQAAFRFEEAASYEETLWTGWGEQVVPPEAEMRRMKAAQAFNALRDADSRSSEIVHGIKRKLFLEREAEVEL